jgi:hypothetical protein
MRAAYRDESDNLIENTTLHHYKINWLMLFKEIISVYRENHAKPINTKCNILTIKADGSYKGLICCGLFRLLSQRSPEYVGYLGNL